MFHRKESSCKKNLILFPPKAEKTILKKHTEAKEKESILNDLDAALVKTSSRDVELSSEYASEQRSRCACRCRDHTFHTNKQKGPSSILGKTVPRCIQVKPK